MKIAMALMLGLVLFNGSALAQQIYKVITPDGRTIYTDEPPEGVEAELVDLPDLIITPALEVRDRTPAQLNQPARVDPRDLPELVIASPVDQQVIPPGQRNLSVTGRVDGTLPDGYSFQLTINGAAQGEPVLVPAWTIEHINRGEQRLIIAIVDSTGRPVKQSQERVVYVIR